MCAFNEFTKHKWAMAYRVVALREVGYFSFEIPLAASRIHDRTVAVTFAELFYGNIFASGYASSASAASCLPSRSNSDVALISSACAPAARIAANAAG